VDGGGGEDVLGEGSLGEADRDEDADKDGGLRGRIVGEDVDRGGLRGGIVVYMNMTNENQNHRMLMKETRLENWLGEEVDNKYVQLG
jgi:hypothetical protein